MPIFLMWLIIIIDFIIPFVPITAFFLVYILIVKPAFFRKWIEHIYTQPKQENV